MPAPRRSSAAAQPATAPRARPVQAVPPPDAPPQQSGVAKAAAAAAAAALASQALPSLPTAALVDAATRTLMEAVDVMFRRRRTELVQYVQEFVKQERPDVPQSRIDQLVAVERQREQAFQEKARRRLQAQLPLALRETDPQTRSAKVTTILEQEKRFLRQRELAAAQRAVAATEADLVREVSPRGAFWQLSPLVREHTLDCLAMGNRFWPWEAIELPGMHPPLHPNCPCRLIAEGEAVRLGLMHPGEADNIDVNAAVGAARAAIQECERLRETLAPEELAEVVQELRMDVLQEAQARWGHGTTKGGQFRPKRGGDPGRPTLRGITGRGREFHLGGFPSEGGHAWREAHVRDLRAGDTVRINGQPDKVTEVRNPEQGLVHLETHGLVMLEPSKPVHVAVHEPDQSAPEPGGERPLPPGVVRTVQPNGLVSLKFPHGATYNGHDVTNIYDHGSFMVVHYDTGKRRMSAHIDSLDAVKITAPPEPGPGPESHRRPLSRAQLGALRDAASGNRVDVEHRQELIDRGYIDRGHAITDRGKQYLAGDAGARSQLDSATPEAAPTPEPDSTPGTGGEPVLKSAGDFKTAEQLGEHVNDTLKRHPTQAQLAHLLHLVNDYEANHASPREKRLFGEDAQSRNHFYRFDTLRTGIQYGLERLRRKQALPVSPEVINRWEEAARAARDAEDVQRAQDGLFGYRQRGNLGSLRYDWRGELAKHGMSEADLTQAVNDRVTLQSKIAHQREVNAAQDLYSELLRHGAAYEIVDHSDRLGTRPFEVTPNRDTTWLVGPSFMQDNGANLRLSRFKTREAAQKALDKMNAQESKRMDGVIASRGQLSAEQLHPDVPSPAQWAEDHRGDSLEQEYAAARDAWKRAHTERFGPGYSDPGYVPGWRPNLTDEQKASLEKQQGAWNRISDSIVHRGAGTTAQPIPEPDSRRVPEPDQPDTSAASGPEPGTGGDVPQPDATAPEPDQPDTSTPEPDTSNATPPEPDGGPPHAVPGAGEGAAPNFDQVSTLLARGAPSEAQVLVPGFFNYTGERGTIHEDHGVLQLQWYFFRQSRDRRTRVAYTHLGNRLQDTAGQPRDAAVTKHYAGLAGPNWENLLAVKPERSQEVAQLARDHGYPLRSEVSEWLDKVAPPAGGEAPGGLSPEHVRAQQLLDDLHGLTSIETYGRFAESDGYAHSGAWDTGGDQKQLTARSFDDGIQLRIDYGADERVSGGEVQPMEGELPDHAPQVGGPPPGSWDRSNVVTSAGDWTTVVGPDGSFAYKVGAGDKVTPVAAEELRSGDVVQLEQDGPTYQVDSAFPSRNDPGTHTILNLRNADGSRADLADLGGSDQGNIRLENARNFWRHDTAVTGVRAFTPTPREQADMQRHVARVAPERVVMGMTPDEAQVALQGNLKPSPDAWGLTNGDTTRYHTSEGAQEARIQLPEGQHWYRMGDDYQGVRLSFAFITGPDGRIVDAGRAAPPGYPEPWRIAHSEDEWNAMNDQVQAAAAERKRAAEEEARRQRSAGVQGVQRALDNGEKGRVTQQSDLARLFGPLAADWHGAVKALQGAGYSLVNTRNSSRRDPATRQKQYLATYKLRGPNGETLRITGSRYRHYGAGMESAELIPAPQASRERITGRPWRNTDELYQDALGRADELAQRHDGVSFVTMITDKEGAGRNALAHHDWSGAIVIGKSSGFGKRMQTYLRKLDKGEPLSEAEHFDFYDALTTLQHEVVHGVGKAGDQEGGLAFGSRHYRKFAGSLSADGVMEEALTEESARLLTLEWLRSNGMTDVLQAVKRRQQAQGELYSDYQLLGSYTNYRRRLQRLFDEAGIPQEDRADLIMRMKFKMTPEERMAAVDDQLRARGFTTSSQQERTGYTPGRKIMGIDVRTDGKTANLNRPVAEDTLDDVTLPVRASEVAQPGDRVHFVDSLSPDEVGGDALEGTVTAINSPWEGFVTIRQPDGHEWIGPRGAIQLVLDGPSGQVPEVPRQDTIKLPTGRQAGLGASVRVLGAGGEQDGTIVELPDPPGSTFAKIGYDDGTQFWTAVSRIAG